MILLVPSIKKKTASKMHSGVASELEQLIHQYAFENQQYLKLIEEKESLVETLIKEREGKQEETQRLKDEITKLDETTKYYHQQFTLNRDNCESLKKTGQVLAEQEHAMRRKLEALIENGRHESEERDRKLQHYRALWKKYEATYKTFPLAKQLQQLEKEAEKLKGESARLKDELTDRKKQLERLQRKRDLQNCSLQQFIVKLAKLKVSSNKIWLAVEKIQAIKAQSHGQDVEASKNSNCNTNSISDDSQDTSCMEVESSPFICMYSEKEDVNELTEPGEGGPTGSPDTEMTDAELSHRSVVFPTFANAHQTGTDKVPPLTYIASSHMQVAGHMIETTVSNTSSAGSTPSGTEDPLAISSTKTALEQHTEPYVSFQNSDNDAFSSNEATVRIHFPLPATSQTGLSSSRGNVGGLKLKTAPVINNKPPARPSGNSKLVKFPTTSIKAPPSALPLVSGVTNPQVLNPQSAQSSFQQLRAFSSAQLNSRPHRPSAQPAIPMIVMQRPASIRMNSSRSIPQRLEPTIRPTLKMSAVGNRPVSSPSLRALNCGLPKTSCMPVSLPYIIRPAVSVPALTENRFSIDHQPERKMLSSVSSVICPEVNKTEHVTTSALQPQLQHLSLHVSPTSNSAACTNTDFGAKASPSKPVSVPNLPSIVRHRDEQVMEVEAEEALNAGLEEDERPETPNEQIVSADDIQISVGEGSPATIGSDSVDKASPFNLERHREKLKAINVSPGYPLHVIQRRMFEAASSEQSEPSEHGDQGCQEQHKPVSMVISSGAGGDNYGQTTPNNSRKGHNEIETSAFKKSALPEFGVEPDDINKRGFDLCRFEGDTAPAFDFNFRSTASPDKTAVRDAGNKEPGSDSPAFQFNFNFSGSASPDGTSLGVPCSTDTFCPTMNLAEQPETSTGSSPKSLMSLFNKGSDQETEKNFFSFDFMKTGQDKAVWESKRNTSVGNEETEGEFMFNFRPSSSPETGQGFRTMFSFGGTDSPNVSPSSTEDTVSRTEKTLNQFPLNFGRSHQTDSPEKTFSIF